MTGPDAPGLAPSAFGHAPVAAPAAGSSRAAGTALWKAPAASAPIRARVRIPGSKSLTNRYFALAAICEGAAEIRSPLLARDTILMARALEAMGARVDLGEEVTRIEPGRLHGGRIDVGLAGTVMRFVPALAAFAEGDVEIDGDPGARRRPMGPIVEALRGLGVEVDAALDAEGEPCLPLVVHGKGGVRGGAVELDASASSQFLSALLLAAPAMAGGLDIRHTGARVPSAPHLRMSVEVLRSAGVQVETYAADGTRIAADGEEDSGEPVRWVVSEGPVRLGKVDVEPDLSNAGPFLAAAMASAGEVSIENWPARTTQPGAQFVQIFEAMGARAGLDAASSTMTLRGPEEIRGIDMDMHDVGELVPTVAAVAALACEPSALRNIGQLRGHETDRLAALVAELERIGCPARVEGDDLLIAPPAGGRGALRPAALRSYADHRMATFAAVLGLAVPGIEIENIATTAKTFPQFAAMWQALAEGGRSVEPEPVDIDAAEAQA